MVGYKRKANEITQDDLESIGPMQVPPYDVSKEPPATSVVTSEEYCKLKSGTAKICSWITDLLKQSKFQNSSTARVLEMTEERLLETNAEEIMVSISGNMGSGKSSTINSIYSQGMLARSDKSGSSVTLVPCIYCGPLPDQRRKFLVEVCFYSREERERFFEAELAAFYRADSQPEDADEGEAGSRRAITASEDIDTRDTVTDMLYSLFLEHRECSSKRAVREFLRQAKSEDDPAILSQLNKWADKLIRRFAEDEDTVVLEASTSQEMLKNLETYSTEMTDDDSRRALSLWPLVHLIKIHFDSPLSKMGVSILDAPGTSDNHIRRETALQLRRECSHSAVVVSSARANSDSAVSKEVKAVRGKGQGRIIVIVTGSDEIDAETLVGGTSADRQEVAELQASATRLQNEANALMLQMSNVFDPAERFELYGRKMNLDTRLIKAQNAERAARIAMRSANTKAKLGEKLVDVNDCQEEIPVISISNTDYQKHRAGFNTLQAPPTLSVEQTNIPALRQHFAQFPNSARMSEIQHLFQTLLPSVIKRAELLAASNADDRKADIEAHVERATKRYEPCIEKILGRVKDYMDLDLLKRVRDLEEDWSNDAEDLCDKWSNTYKAGPMLNLMNRNGLRRGSKKSTPVILSGELLHLASGSISAAMAIARTPIYKEVREIVRDMKGIVKDMVHAINNDTSATIVDVQPFLDYVKSERRVLVGIITNLMKDFMKGMDLINAKATTEVEDAYLVKQMLPVYAKVRKIKGGKNGILPKPAMGYAKERHIVFKNEVIASSGVWFGSCSAMEEDLKLLLSKSKADLTREIGNIFEGFRTSFDGGWEATEIDEESQKELQAMLKTVLDDVSTFIEKELNPAWEALASNARYSANSELDISV
ncbi:hypothetical protein WHR41_06887 [Cladosporium halotolerans]|uniref:Uncharacterized protein n=1 Tax=Cladosporium halotolerans TaxID=1052096 RepID=A0AB34KKY7_9PEZI